MIAYPDGIYNETVLNEETMIIDEADAALFDTVVLYNVKESIKNLKQFGKPVDKTGLATFIINVLFKRILHFTRECIILVPMWYSETMQCITGPIKVTAISLMRYSV